MAKERRIVAAETESPCLAVRPIVVVTRKLPDVIETRMMELFDARLNISDQPFGRDAMVEAVQEAAVLVPTVTDKIDARVLAEAGPQLKLIASFGTGVDHIDLHAAKEKGILVTNTPGVLTEDTADMTMALILAVSRRLVEEGTAPPSRRLGKVGADADARSPHPRQTARDRWDGPDWPGRRPAARGFGLSIHYHNRRRVHEELEASEADHWENLDQMLSRMDIVSVNCPHTTATYHPIARPRLSLMQLPRDHRRRLGAER